MRNYYFPGCSSIGIAKELDISFRAIASKLEIDIVGDDRWSCCGAGAIEDANLSLSHDINERNLDLAEEFGADLLTVCNTCQVVLKRASLERGRNVQVKHLLEYVVDVGFDALKKNMVHPLDLKVAPFYGCHILRPSYVLQFNNPENPNSLENVITALGGKPIDYVGRLGCCGFHILLSKESASISMIGSYLQNAISKGAQCIVTPCPLCHTALDTYQKKALSKDEIPILHLSQLIGLAFGLKPNKIGLNRHVVSTSILKHF